MIRAGIQCGSFLVLSSSCHDFSQKSKSGSRTQSETITGLVVTLSVGGEEILKQSHPENFLDRLEEEAKREQERARARR